MDWLVLATDPYHDFDRNIAGFPDITTARSIVKCVKKTMTISAPASAAGGNWDCHIFNTPFQEFDPTSNYTLQYVSKNGVASATANLTDYVMDSLWSISGPAGSTLGFDQVVAPTSVINTLGYADGLTAADGRPSASRLIGLGFEVANTTSDLYRQGTVTVYKTGWHAQSGTLCNATGYSAAPTRYYNGIPLSSIEAYRIPGARQWEAEKGVYMTPTLKSIDVPSVMAVPTSVSFLNRPVATGAAFSVAYQPASALTSMQPSIQLTNEFNLAGSYFSGLSNPTTLVVTVKWFLEIFPSTTDPFVDFATPSATYDEEALSIYTRTMNKMPPGVPKGDNEAGGWFKKVLSAIGTIVGMASPLLGPLGPVAGAAGGALKLASMAMKDKKPDKGSRPEVVKPSTRQKTIAGPPVMTSKSEKRTGKQKR